MLKESEQIECKKRFMGRAIVPLLLLILFLVILTGIWKVGPFGWIIFGWITLHSSVAFPDVIIHHDGMELIFTFTRSTIKYDELRKIQINALDIRIYSHSFPFLCHTLALNPRAGVIAITPLLHQNYETAQKYIRDYLLYNIT